MVEEVLGWEEELTRVAEGIGSRFARPEPRRRVLGYLRGLLSPVSRKNGWQLAEWLGDRRPDGVQRLLYAVECDTEGLREDLRDYVVAHLGDSQTALIVDETGFLKKGTASVGVQRQYSGTAGRVENCQIGVFLGYATEKGAALIDRALYLPREWAEDPARRQKAGVPDSASFATKPQLARQMLQRALEAGVACRWADPFGGRRQRLRIGSSPAGVADSTRTGVCLGSGFRRMGQLGGGGFSAGALDFGGGSGAVFAFGEVATALCGRRGWRVWSV